MSAALVSGLLQQRLWIVSGKGGVGKSTLSAALALASARRGRRTLVCEVNVEERVAPLLGHPPSGPEVRRLEENLWSVDTRPEEAMREYGLMTLRFETLYRAVFENRVVKQLLRFIPSLQELVLLGKILFHVRETEPDGRFKYDTIVLDAPATGHAVSLLRLPQVLLDTVPPGPVSTQATWMRDLLQDPATTAVVCATLAEEMPLSETRDLVQTLRQELHLHPTALVLNQFVAERFSEAERAALSSLPHARALAEAHEADAARCQDARTTLAALKLPVYPLPRLFSPALGRTEIETLSRTLDALLGAP